MKDYTTNIGDYLVIWITGMVDICYIAEITESSPLKMKVEESGPFAHLKSGDFIIKEEYTKMIQEDNRKNGTSFLDKMDKENQKVASGLKSLGLNQLLYIHSPNKVS